MFTTNVNHPVPRLLRNCPRVIIQFLNSVLSYMNLALLELLPWWFFFSLWIFCKPQKLSRTFHDRFMLNVALSQTLLTLCALLGSSDVTNCHYWEAYHKMSYFYATQYSLPLWLSMCNSLYFLLSYGHQRSISWSEKRKTCIPISLSQAGLSRSEIPDDNTL